MSFISDNFAGPAGSTTTIIDQVSDFDTLTALYDAADAAEISSGAVCRVAWAGDAHVADGEIVTQWDGTNFSPDPMTANVEVPGWLFEAADWTQIGPTGSLSADGDGRPQFIVDHTVAGTGGIELNSRYLSSIGEARFRVDVQDGDNNTGGFNRYGVALFGADNDFDVFNAAYLFASISTTTDYSAIARAYGESFAEATSAIGRAVTASEQLVINMQLAYEVNNYRLGASFGFADGTKGNGFESPAKVRDMLETGFKKLTPALMCLLPNTATGTTTLTLLGVQLAGHPFTEV